MNKELKKIAEITLKLLSKKSWKSLSLKEVKKKSKLELFDELINNKQELLNNIILPKQAWTIDYSWSGIMGVGKTKSPIVKMLNNNTAIGVRLGGMGVALGAQVGKKLASYF